MELTTLGSSRTLPSLPKLHNLNNRSHKRKSFWTCSNLELQNLRTYITALASRLLKSEIPLHCNKLNFVFIHFFSLNPGFCCEPRTDWSIFVHVTTSRYSFSVHRFCHIISTNWKRIGWIIWHYLHSCKHSCHIAAYSTCTLCSWNSFNNQYRKSSFALHVFGKNDIISETLDLAFIHAFP